MHPKYSLLKFERRWVVSFELIPNLSTSRVRRIEDKYLEGGRLRLRTIHEQRLESIYKLSKKYICRDGGYESVVITYLSKAEHDSILVIPGVEVRKDRYCIDDGFLDIYDFPKQRHAIFEMEFDSSEDAAAFVPPTFVGSEVTRNMVFNGYALAFSIA